MPGVGLWPCSCPHSLWHISDLRGSGEVGYVKPQECCDTVYSCVPPVPPKCWSGPTALPHRLSPPSHSPLSPPGQAFHSSCSTPGTLSPAVPGCSTTSLSQESWGKVSAVTQPHGCGGEGYPEGQRHPQHPQPCSESCQTPLRSPMVSQTSCCREEEVMGKASGAGQILAVWRCF